MVISTDVPIRIKTLAKVSNGRTKPLDKHSTVVVTQHKQEHPAPDYAPVHSLARRSRPYLLVSQRYRPWCTACTLCYPRLKVEWPPGGAVTLDEGLPVMTFPQFWLTPLANAFDESTA